MVLYERVNVSNRSGRAPFHGSLVLASTWASRAASAVTQTRGGGSSSSETATVAAPRDDETV